MTGHDTTGIGYGRPPLHSRFKPGESGNPQGRRKGALSFKSDLLDELSETIAVPEASGEVRITKQRAIVKQLVAASIAGDAKAASALGQFVDKGLIVGFARVRLLIAEEFGAQADESAAG
jgi:hypothetical protein